MDSAKTPYKHVCIIGCGDIGQRVAQRWQAQNTSVTGIVATDTSRVKLSEQDITAWQCQLDDPNSALPTLPKQTLIYYFVPPPGQGTHDTHCQTCLNQLSAQASHISRIIAISTTGVYGNREGAQVTEDDTPNPQVDRAKRRYDMECQLKDWCTAHDTDLIILRVGGIYGPGRLPLARIQNKVPVLLPELAPKTNRIHADDLAVICIAAAKVDHSYRVYNVSDGTDSNMTEYFFTLADYFQLERPPAVDWETATKTISPGMLSYLRESRRVDNQRLLNELDIQLCYPNLLAGLKSCQSTSDGDD